MDPEVRERKGEDILPGFEDEDREAVDEKEDGVEDLRGPKNRLGPTFRWLPSCCCPPTSRRASPKKEKPQEGEMLVPGRAPKKTWRIRQLK